MTLRVCPTPGCPTLTTGGPCPQHAAEKRRARAAATRQGYGWAHQQRRTALLATLTPGTPCPICHQPMHADQPLDVDHTKPIVLGATTPGDRLTHAACNRSHGGKLGRALQLEHDV